MSKELQMYIDKHAIKDHMHCEADSDHHGTSEKMRSQRSLTIVSDETHENPLAVHHSNHQSLVKSDSVAQMGMTQAEI